MISFLVLNKHFHLKGGWVLAWDLSQLGLDSDVATWPGAAIPFSGCPCPPAKCGRRSSAAGFHTTLQNQQGRGQLLLSGTYSRCSWTERKGVGTGQTGVEASAARTKCTQSSVTPASTPRVHTKLLSRASLAGYQGGSSAQER